MRGPDIHRNYESMLVGSVPINIRNTIEFVFDYHGANAIFLESWEELTHDYLNNLLVKTYNTSDNDLFLSAENHISKIKKILGK